MELVAKSLARQRNLPVARPLTRVLSQELHTMGRQQRIAMKAELFALSGSAVPPKILLIDDILTTGTTMNAAAELLVSAGASLVYGAVVARQPMQN
jgi:predicted amidophosphoribosyltransferase